MNLNKFLLKLQILHSAMLAGQVFFIAVVLYLHYSAQIEVNIISIKKYLYAIVPLFIAGGFILGTFIYKKRLQTLNETSTIEFKSSLYRSANIIRYAMLEGPSLLSIVILLLTNDFFFLNTALFTILLFAFFRPTQARMITDLQLSESDFAS